MKDALLVLIPVLAIILAVFWLFPWLEAHPTGAVVIMLALVVAFLVFCTK